ncbi:MAG: ATP-binding protein [Sandaracinus sp.]
MDAAPSSEVVSSVPPPRAHEDAPSVVQRPTSSAAPRPRLTIPTRILGAILSLLFAFFVGSATSVITHQRSAETLRLLHEGYLPLALTLGSAKADHAIYGSMLARMLSEPDASTSREWVDRAVRVVMPATIEAALSHVARAQRLEPSGEDAILLGELAELLGEVQRGYADTEQLDAYFRALERGDRGDAQDALDALRQRDRTLAHDLRRSFDHVQRRVAAISAVAAEEQSRSVWITAIMTALGLLFGLAVSFWARRLLAPLPRLEARVLEVASGNLASGPLVVDPQRRDEIGRLAIELEAMVEALRARDRQLREAADRVIRSERLAAMGRMAAHVTHEVRNPLTSIHLNTELLEEELASLGKDDGSAQRDEIRKLLRSIRREVDRLGSITEEYLRLARLPSPKLEPEDLGALTKEVVTFVRREMEGEDVSVELSVEEGLPLVSADEAQIRQALLNLLRNAREAMPGGGRVHVSVAREAELVVVRIADEGEGVPEDVRAKMFDAFYSTKERGTGLGLPLTQQIVLAHRGAIRCEDREGGGAVFVLSFPSAGFVEEA